MAVANSPTGPYTEQFQIIPPWAHNPEAIHTTDGNVVIYTLGNGIVGQNGPEYRCDLPNPPPPAPRPPRPPPAPPGPATHTITFIVHYADVNNVMERSAWKSMNVSVLDFPVEFQFQGNWNPAPVQLPDGRVRIMMHTGWSKTTGLCPVFPRLPFVSATLP